MGIGQIGFGKRRKRNDLSGSRSALPIDPREFYELNFQPSHLTSVQFFTNLISLIAVINTWLKQYNHIRPHQSLNMRPPVPETLLQTGT